MGRFGTLHNITNTEQTWRLFDMQLARRRERAIGDISRSNSHSQINRQWRAYRSVEAVNQWTKPLTPLSPSDIAPIISYLETVANAAAEQSFHSKRSIKSGFMQARSRYSPVISVIALTVFTRRPRSLQFWQSSSSRRSPSSDTRCKGVPLPALVSIVRTIQIVQVISRFLRWLDLTVPDLLYYL